MDIYVGNLSFQLSEAELQELFEEFGEVSSVKIVTDKMTGKSKGFAFVGMDDDASGQRAIDQLNGRPVNGRNIIVNQARPKTETGGGNRGGGGGGYRDGGNRGGGGGYRDGGGRDGGYKKNSW